MEWPYLNALSDDLPTRRGVQHCLSSRSRYNCGNTDRDNLFVPSSKPAVEVVTAVWNSGPATSLEPWFGSFTSRFEAHSARARGVGSTPERRDWLADFDPT